MESDDQLWSVALQLETDLTQREAAKRRDRRVTLHDPAADRLRLLFLDAAEDLLVADRPLQVANLDERLWVAAIYTRVEELRSIIAKWGADANEELANAVEIMRQHLELATYFYQTLIMTLQSRLDSDLLSVAVRIYFAAHGKSPVASDEDEATRAKFRLSETRYLTLYRCIIFLGDIARYMSTYCSTTQTDPAELYRRAMLVNPNNGKPQSLLAILASNKKDNLEAIFCYSLSIANVKPFSVASRNLNILHSKITEKSATIDPHTFESTSASEETIISVYMQYHRLIVFPSDELLIRSDSYDANLAWQNVIENSLSQLFDVSTAAPRRCTQIIVTLIVGYMSFDERFKSSEKPAIRQRIRNLQVMILSSLFHLAGRMFDLLQSSLQSAFDAGVDPFVEDGAPTGLELLAPAGLCCVWLATTIDAFKVFGNYTASGTALATLSERSVDFLRSLAALANSVSSFADMDGSGECLPEDTELLGLSPLSGFYRRLLPFSVRRALDSRFPSWTDMVVARVARVAWSASVIADEKSVELFHLDEKSSLFTVRDEKSKKAERQKVAKALAVQLLKDQVGSLEESLKKIPVVPVVVFDLDGYLHNLRFIKSLLMSRSCKIILPLDVMQDLDRIKSGRESINRKAREAIRYLEQRFKFRSEFLAAQRAGEGVTMWSADGTSPGVLKLSPNYNVLTDKDESGEPVRFIVPKHLRGLLKCCGHYQKNVAPQTADAIESDQVPFALVSGDKEVVEIARSVGIVVKTMKEWRAWSLSRAVRPSLGTGRRFR